MSDMSVDGDTDTTYDSSDMMSYEPTDSDSEKQGNANVVVGEARPRRNRRAPVRFANLSFPPLRRTAYANANVMCIDSDTDIAAPTPNAAPTLSNDCVICLEALDNGDGIAPPCAQCKKVVGHTPCLLQAAEYSRQCPLCRFDSATLAGEGD